MHELARPSQETLLMAHRTNGAVPGLPLRCGCYDFSVPSENPATCAHCWHKQHDMKRQAAGYV